MSPELGLAVALDLEPRPMIIITRIADAYVAECGFDQRMVPKQVGFWWHGGGCRPGCQACAAGIGKKWWTPDPNRAAKLAEYADETCRAELGALKSEHEGVLAASHATDADVEIPVPEGLSYLPFQKAGVAYASSRPATLIADEMGLGKTVQALGVINCDPKIHRVLIVCPASLKLNWKRESERWLVRPMRIAVANSKSPAGAIQGADLVIANYDILHRLPVLAETEWDLLVVDEAHYCKTSTTRRAKHVFALRARRKLYLTGTPMVNRPRELFPLLNSLDSKAWPNFFQYAKRYCAARKERVSRTKEVWNFDGASHLDELQDKLRSTIMVRRLKADVLTELPAKRRQIIEIPDDEMREGECEAMDCERDEWSGHRARLDDLEDAVAVAKPGDDYAQAVANLRRAWAVAFESMSATRRLTALAKADSVIEHIKAVVDNDPTYKIVVFGHHLDVIAKIADAFGDRAVRLTGETSMEDRQAAVDRFQNDSSCQVFAGGILAAGVGLTLTASSHVLFAELDWVPGNVTQAEDRCHRIGQRNSVLVQHLVLEGSIDALMAKKLIAKQAVIDQALDVEPQPIEVPPPAELTERQKRVATEAAQISEAQILAVHHALGCLAAFCDGAREQDGMGFNKIDTSLGHSLAAASSLTPKQAVLGRRIALRYQRQLPGELVNILRGGKAAA